MEISWTTKEFEKYQRGLAWYIVMTLIALLLIALAWWLKLWMLIAVVVVAFVVLIVIHRANPREIVVTVNDENLIFGPRTLPLKRIKSFWVVKTPDGDKINFVASARFSPLLTFSIPEEKIAPLRDLLKDKIAEEAGREEDIIDRFNRFLKI